MVGGRVRNGRRLRDLRRVLGDQFAGRIDKNRRLGVGDLLDPLALAIIIVGANNKVAVSNVFDLRLFIVAVEDKGSELTDRRKVTGDVAVLVLLEICTCKAIGFPSAS